MAQKIIGLSRDLIIHPGETLYDVLEERNLTQKELAVRTGFTEKHISTVINGQKSISTKFAKCLEYVFNIDSCFWLNLQSNYDRELLEFEEYNNITVEEVSVTKTLKDVIKYLENKKYISKNLDEITKVLELRKFFGISNLTAIPKLTIQGAFRGSIKHPVDPYVLFAWKVICEIKTKDMPINGNLDIKKLEDNITRIKDIMFIQTNKMQSELTKIFSECGIAFSIVKHFKGAPVQGFINKDTGGRVSLCMTIRQAYADIFWFTLFHEIAHILNGDADRQLIDFTFIENQEEIDANFMARNFLIKDEDYSLFVNKNDFAISAISTFASAVGVPNYIVIGRLQKDDKINYNQYNNEKIRYRWAE